MNRKLISRAAILFLLFSSLAYSQWFQQVSGTGQNLKNVNSHHGNENNVWACGENGVIVHTINGGTNWSLQNSGTTNDLYAVCFMEITGGPVFAVGENGTILRTTNDGLNWVSIPSPTTRTLRDISDFNFVIVGDSGTILKSTNQGLNWSIANSPVTQDLYAVACTFSFYAVGKNGTILRSNYPGTVWESVNSGTSQDLFGVPLFGSRDITVGKTGLIWRSTDIGVSWFAQNSNTNLDLRSVEYSANNTSFIFVCGAGGTILKSTNAGTNWGFQNSTTNQDLNSIFFYLSTTGYAVGNNGMVVKTTNGGGPIFTGLNNIPGEIPETYRLLQNYPNPFNPETKIGFSIPKDGLNSLVETKLAVYDISGKEIAILVNGNLQPGKYEISFDGSHLTSGVYFYKLFSGDFSGMGKMVLIK